MSLAQKMKKSCFKPKITRSGDFKYFDKYTQIHKACKCGLHGMNYRSDMSNRVQIFDTEMGRDLIVKDLIKLLFPPINIDYSPELLEYAANTDVRRIIEECIGKVRRDAQYIDFIRNAFIISDGLGHRNVNVRKINEKYTAFLHTSQEQLVNLMFEEFYVLWTDIGINEKYRSYHKFKTLCEFYARIIVVIELDFYMRAKHPHSVGSKDQDQDQADESEEIRRYLDRGILKYIFKLHVDIESGHTTVYRYRYQEGGDYIREPKEYTAFNTNIVLGYVGVNDVDVKNDPFITSVINDPEKKKKLVDGIISALDYQSGLTFSEDKSKQYFKITDKVAVDGRFMCPLPISREYLDIIVNYIHEFLGIKVRRIEKGNHEFVSVETGDNTFTLNSSNTTYYYYLNCIYKNPGKIHKPMNTKDHSDPTSYLFKEWNCDAGCFSMIVEPEKIGEFLDSLREDCRKQYEEKEIEECYDTSLKPSISQVKSQYGTVFKAKPDLIMKLRLNSKANIIANGFSENSKVTMLTILKVEHAYDIKTARIHLNRIMLCKYIFDTANAFDYYGTIRPIVKNPMKLFTRVIYSTFGLYAYTKPLLQYHSAIRLANLANGNDVSDGNLEIDSLETFESLLDDDEQKTSKKVDKWKEKYGKAISDFESTCNQLVNRYKNVEEFNKRSGKKKENSVYAVYSHMNDIGKALIALLECIKPDISKEEKELIREAYEIPELETNASSFYTYGQNPKFNMDYYSPTPDVIMGTIIQKNEDEFKCGDNRLHHDIQSKRYPEIINDDKEIIFDVPKLFNDMLLPNVKAGLEKYFKTTVHQQEDGEDDGEVEERITKDYEIPNCDWLLKLYQLFTLNWANSGVKYYIRASAKNMLIRIRTMFNPKNEKLNK